MLNPLRPVMTRVFTPVGAALARTPVTANAITIVGTVGVAGGALGLFPIGELFPGALTCTIFVLLDMLDGVLARIKGTSGTWGAFLDSTLDRIADAGIFSGLVIWFFRGGHDPLLGGVSLFCLVAGILVSYTKARAEGLGLQLRRGPDRTARAHAHLADRGRRIRPRRAVHSQRGALGARGGKRLYVRAAGTRGPPGRPASGGRVRKAGLSGSWVCLSG